MGSRNLPLKIGAGVLLTLILLGAFAIATISLIDWNKHRDFVASLVERFTDTKVGQLGSLRLVTSLSPTITVENLKFAANASDALITYFSAARLELKAELLPLFFEGEARLFKLNLSHARITLNLAEKERLKKKAQAIPLPFVGSGTIEDVLITTNKQIATDKFLTIALAKLDIFSFKTDEPVTWQGSGTIAGLGFDLTGQFGSFSQFRAQNLDYPISLAMFLLDDKFLLNGTLQRGDHSSWDIRTHVRGKRLKELAEAFGVVLGSIPPYKVDFSLVGSSPEWMVKNLRATLGRSQLSGELRLNIGGKRPFITTTMTINQLNVDDVLAFTPPTSAKATKAPGKKRDATEKKKAVEKRLPLELLEKVDVEAVIAILAITGHSLDNLTGAHKITVKLRDGALVVDPVSLVVAHGTIGGRISINAKSQPYLAEVRLGLKKIDLSRLVAPLVGDTKFAGLNPEKLISGNLGGFVKLKTHGDSMSAWLDHLNGDIRMAMEQGSVASALVSALGIDIPKTLVALLAGNSTTKIGCMIAALEVNAGVVQNKAAFLATTSYNVFVSGKTDLNAKTIDYTIEARSKDLAIGSTQSRIHVGGTWDKIDLKILNEEVASRLGIAALAATINPALAIIPFIDLGLEEKGKCAIFRDELHDIEMHGEKSLKP